jgi:hypothetical protein
MQPNFNFQLWHLRAMLLAIYTMDSGFQPFSLALWSGYRARIFKCLWGPGIDSKEWIPPAYVAWRAGTITLFLLGSYKAPHRLFKNSSSGGEFLGNSNSHLYGVTASRVSWPWSCNLNSSQSFFIRECTFTSLTLCFFSTNLNSISEKSYLRFEGRKPVFVKRDMGVYMTDL